MSTAGRDVREAWGRGQRPGGPRPAAEAVRPGPETRGDPEPPRHPSLDRTTYLARSHRMDGHVGT